MDSWSELENRTSKLARDFRELKDEAIVIIFQNILNRIERLENDFKEFVKEKN